jgi:hypothetical protein
MKDLKIYRLTNHIPVFCGQRLFLLQDGIGLENRQHGNAPPYRVGKKTAKRT